MQTDRLKKIKPSPPPCPERIRLKHKLELVGYQPGDVAEVAEVTVQYVYMYFRGHRNSSRIEEAIKLLLSQAEAEAA